jgi:hypothetical protein
MPPRHGKSELVSKYFPAWFLGCNPSKRIILASYAAEFAASWGRKARDVLTEIGPRYFDGLTIRSDSSAAHWWDLDEFSGGMQTSGVGGGVTGKGADLFIIDDPVKDAVQANSEVYRQRNWDWYQSVAYTRLEPDGAVVIMQTRWHEEDLAGHVLQHAKQTGESWDVLNLPALAEEPDPLGRQPGEPLWPERFSRADLLRIKATLGSYWWSAMYQGSPMPNEGGTFKRSWLRYWREEGDLYVLECA